jgi:hypothetical protein
MILLKRYLKWKRFMTIRILWVKIDGDFQVSEIIAFKEGALVFWVCRF